MTMTEIETPTEIIAKMIGRTCALDGGELFTPTAHVVRQAADKGFSLVAVMKAANDPGHSYDNGRYEGQRRHIRGPLVAVVNVENRKIITVYANVVETAVRGDQVDADAQRYARQIGNR